MYRFGPRESETVTKLFTVTQKEMRREHLGESLVIGGLPSSVRVLNVLSGTPKTIDDNFWKKTWEVTVEIDPTLVRSARKRPPVVFEIVHGDHIGCVGGSRRQHCKGLGVSRPISTKKVFQPSRVVSTLHIRRSTCIGTLTKWLPRFFFAWPFGHVAKAPRSGLLRNLFPSVPSRTCPLLHLPFLGRRDATGDRQTTLAKDLAIFLPVGVVQLLQAVLP